MGSENRYESGELVHGVLDFGKRAVSFERKREGRYDSGTVTDDRKTGTWLTFAGETPTSMEVRRCRLTVEQGHDAGKEIEIESPTIFVGARKGCDLVLHDKQVSGHHFEIALQPKGYRLRDLDSTNGTFVSGVCVGEAYLEPGHTIQVGETSIRFEPLGSSGSVELSPHSNFGDMVGQSAVMRALFATLEKVSPTSANVLIHGETGVGKELVAQAIHERSPRRDGPFVVVDCGSIPTNLISSELFGHEKGAFTGALSSYAGAFERANGGTIFLDELGELPLELQPSLLGVLERRVVRRVGGKDSIPIDVRVVAATNRHLVKEMNKGRFREDLYYRVAVVSVEVPPLRERLDDVSILVDRFLDSMPGGSDIMLEKETLRQLSRHDYPGNVRELRNLVERIVVFNEDAELLSIMNRTIGGEPGGGIVPVSSDGPLFVDVDVDVPFKKAKRTLVDEFEKRFLTKLIDAHRGNVSAAARGTGLDRMTVHKMLQRHGLVRSSKLQKKS